MRAGHAQRPIAAIATVCALVALAPSRADADLSPPDYRAYHAARAHAEGLLALRSGRNETALGSARRAVELAPDHPDHLYLLGVCQLFAEQYEASRDTLSRVVELAPELVPAHHDLGLIQLKLGDADGARASFQRVEALQPDTWIGPYRRAQTEALLARDFAACERALATAVERGLPWLAALPVDPEWAEVADDPAFLAMIERLLE